VANKHNNISGRSTDREQKKFYPYTTENFKDATTKGDLTVIGTLFAEINSLQLGEILSIGATAQEAIITDLVTDIQAYLARSRIIDRKSEPAKYVDRYFPFLKTDPEGQPQPDDSEIFNSTPFIDNITGEEKHYFMIALPSFNSTITDTWYLRSPTPGVKNLYVKTYIGVITDPNAIGLYWKSNTTKDIKEKLNLVTSAGGLGVDIEVQLGKSFKETQDDVFSHYVVCDNAFTIYGATLGFIPPPFTQELLYITGDGALWRERQLSSILTGSVPPHGVVDGEEGDNYVFQDGRNTTQYIYKNNIAGNDSWYRFTSSVVRSGFVTDIEQSINLNGGQAFGMSVLIPETDLGSTIVGIKTNNMPNGETCDLYIAYISPDFTTVIQEEVVTVTDSDIGRFTFDYSSLLESYVNQVMNVVIVANNYSSGGVLSIYKLKQKGVSNDEIVFRKDNVNGLPSAEDWTTNRVTTNDAVWWASYRK